MPTGVTSISGIMLLMGNNTLKNVRALVARDLVDAARNPTVLMSCAAGVILSVFIGLIAAGSSRLSPGEADAFALVASCSIAPAFAGCVTELYVMAEERERGVYLTLREAGVTAGEIAVSKWLAATVTTLIVQAVACLLQGFAPTATACLLAFSLVVVQPLLLAGLACGLSAREQMASSLLAVPLTAAAVAPVLSYISSAVRNITWFLLLGPAAELLSGACGLPAAAPVPVLVALVAGWIIAAAVLAVRRCQRFARELDAERERLV